MRTSEYLRLAQPFSRRAFLQRSALAAAAAAMPSSLLTACGSDGGGVAGQPLTADPNIAWWLQNNYAPIDDEIEAFNLPVRGAIPPELNGLYVRNGSNPQTHESPHWFLGDGMVHGIRIEGGRAVSYRNRYVRTPFWEAGVSLDGAIDAGLPPGGGNSQSNVSCVYHAGKLLTSGEIGFAYQLDPNDLSTIGVHDFDGRLNTSFTAHPKIDPATGFMHFFGYWLVEPYLTYHVADAGGAIVHSQVIEVAGPTMIHSFAITESDVVFWEFPVVFDFARAIDSVIDAFSWQPEYGARIGVMPLGGNADQIRWVEVEPQFVFHEVNAYRDGDEVIVDVARHPEMFNGDDLGQSDTSVRRWYINTAGEHLTFRDEIVTERGFELPSHDRRLSGRRHRYGWFVNSRDNDQTVDLGGIARVDFQSGGIQEWEPGITNHCGEAFFVPAGPGEGEGWLFTFVHDHHSDRSRLAILDAQNIRRGPIAEIELPRRVPYGFHAVWIPA